MQSPERVYQNVVQPEFVLRRIVWSGSLWVRLGTDNKYHTLRNTWNSTNGDNLPPLSQLPCIPFTFDIDFAGRKSVNVQYSDVVLQDCDMSKHVKSKPKKSLGGVKANLCKVSLCGRLTFIATKPGIRDEPPSNSILIIRSSDFRLLAEIDCFYTLVVSMEVIPSGNGIAIVKADGSVTIYAFKHLLPAQLDCDPPDRNINANIYSADIVSRVPKFVCLHAVSSVNTQTLSHVSWHPTSPSPILVGPVTDAAMVFLVPKRAEWNRGIGWNEVLVSASHTVCKGRDFLMTKFSPTGCHIVSSDIEGNILVWSFNASDVSQTRPVHHIATIIHLRDIAWDVNSAHGHIVVGTDRDWFVYSLPREGAKHNISDEGTLDGHQPTSRTPESECVVTGGTDGERPGSFGGADGVNEHNFRPPAVTSRPI